MTDAAPTGDSPDERPPRSGPPVPKAGGKAKASKGKGRAPKVKGAQRVGKRRQSR